MEGLMRMVLRWVGNLVTTGKNWEAARSEVLLQDLVWQSHLSTLHPPNPSTISRSFRAFCLWNYQLRVPQIRKEAF